MMLKDLLETGCEIFQTKFKRIVRNDNYVGDLYHKETVGLFYLMSNSDGFFAIKYANESFKEPVAIYQFKEY